MSYLCGMEKELRIRLSSELKRKLEKQAKSLNLSLSSYVRLILTTNGDKSL